MQIHSINNNTSFGTRVLIRPGTKEIIEKSKIEKEIFKQIENLKNNGIDDFLILSHNRTKSEEPHINAEIVEFIGDKCYINSFSKDYPLKEKFSKNDKFINIESIYKLSKVKMIEIGIITKKLFDTMMHEYQEI